MENKPTFSKASIIGQVTGVVSVLLVFLLPVLTGFVFFRVLDEGGAPFWFYLVQGLVFLVALGQAAYYVAVVIRHIVRRRNGGKER